MKVDNMPFMIRIALWGIKTRKAACVYLLFSSVLSLAFMYFNYLRIHDPYLYACILIPIWYFIAIRWADRNTPWKGLN